MSLNLFEFEVKRIFQEVGIPIPQGTVVSDPLEAGRVAAEMQGPVVIKPQVLAGGRGKAGRIGTANSPAEAEAIAKGMLGDTYNAWTIDKLLVEQKLDVARELYLSAIVDAQTGGLQLLAGGEGGQDVEQASAGKEAVQVEQVDVFRGPGQYQLRNLFGAIALPSGQLKQAQSIASKLYTILRRHGAQLVEINPLVITADGEVVAVDGKMRLDPNQMRLHPTITLTRDRFQDELEFEAAEAGLSYVKLDGDIGVLCTGAGLTLATLDMIMREGGKPANFLEFGGATYENASQALSIVLKNPAVRVVLINTFGLVARADVIADGLIKAIAQLKPEVPIFAAIRGTGEKKAAALMQSAGIEPLGNLEEVVQKAVAAAQAGSR
ncbi:MAG: acetate--CoA ligase family protein [Anaerolineales bacterium]|jgi:succinyl-CoA synthetase beta subunit